jgi:DHA1 family bicyclomycin/chloramphenicol resistance-like MFS transporter
MTALTAVASDVYLPSLPEVIEDFGTSRQWVQTTLTSTMVGGAVGQLLIGPLSDRFGRRRPVLLCLAIHIAASALIVFTPSIGLLICLRFLQGIGSAAPRVVAMAIVRDLRTGPKAAKMLSQLMLVVGVGPLLAPIIGTGLAGLGTWRYSFVFVTAVGVTLAGFVWAQVPDTRTERVRQVATGLGPAFKAYWQLLRDYRFMSFAILPGLAQCVLACWIISSPFLVRTELGKSSAVYALAFAICGASIVAGAQLNAALVLRFHPKILLTAALPAELALALAGLGVSCAGGGSGLVSLVAGVSALLFVNGTVPSNASALALTRHGESAGAASALIGTLQLSFQAVAMGVLSAIGISQRNMTAIQIMALVAALAILVVGGGCRR